MSEFKAIKILQINQLSLFLSHYYKWEYSTKGDSIRLKIKTDEWFLLEIQLTPKSISSKWKFGNDFFHYTIGWPFARILKGKHHSDLQLHIHCFLTKQVTRTT